MADSISLPVPVLGTADPSIAVLIPCWNEALTIAKVVGEFRAALQGAVVYVYDNNSTDGTAAVAHASGAVLRRESQQGKGYVVRRMFADIEADIYVLVDGDDTYEAADAPSMVRLLLENGLDMVNGVRVSQEITAYRHGHQFGNRILTGLVRAIFGDRVSDMLSGYRIFSRRFVKSFPALATGFETETEFTVHALELNMPVGEIQTNYKGRPEGSASKLHTYSDGLRILRTIILLVKEEKPFQFFSLCGLLMLGFSIGLSIPVVLEFLRTGLVPRLPTAVLSMDFLVLSFLSFFAGLILDSVARGRKEMKRLAYLAIPVIRSTAVTLGATALLNR